MRSESTLSEIVPHFNFDGEYLRAEIFKFGHIHDTYFVYFRKPDASEHRCIMQGINLYVFQKPEELMENITGVTKHLQRKIIASGGDPKREGLTLVPTRDGKFFHKTDSGEYWRAYNFIEGARTYMQPASTDHVYSAARAYGTFQRNLSDFPVDRLHETIPNFHHTVKRFENFVQVVEKDGHNRARDVGEEINFVLRRADETSVLVDLVDAGDLPLRVTHNDTKFNNVMIDDQTGEGVCVIDLDTVMPGSSLYDFGDAIRSITNTGAEDEPDLSKVRFSLEAFEAYTRGYLETTRDGLTRAEIEHLAFSARLMTLECGMRFLTDHLDGDVYFKTHRPDHNLDRCRTQFKLVADMEQEEEKMGEIVGKYRFFLNPL
jgi:Ser/Thr protein kinase RdoA (MazF antagonist)